MKIFNVIFLGLIHNLALNLSWATSVLFKFKMFSIHSGGWEGEKLVLILSRGYKEQGLAVFNMSSICGITCFMTLLLVRSSDQDTHVLNETGYVICFFEENIDSSGIFLLKITVFLHTWCTIKYFIQIVVLIRSSPYKDQTNYCLTITPVTTNCVNGYLFNKETASVDLWNFVLYSPWYYPYMRGTRCHIKFENSFLLSFFLLIVPRLLGN